MTHLKFRRNVSVAVRLLFLGACLSTTSLVAANSVIDQTYPQAQAEVLETVWDIAPSITDVAGQGYDGEYMYRLISFHAYGDKFVELHGGKCFDSAVTENIVSQLFGEDIDLVIDFGEKVDTFNVAVYYGNVSNLTFI